MTAPLEKIAEGREAEMFAWENGRVLRLDRPGWGRGRFLDIAAKAGILWRCWGTVAGIAVAGPSTATLGPPYLPLGYARHAGVLESWTTPSSIRGDCPVAAARIAEGIEVERSGLLLRFIDHLPK